MRKLVIGLVILFSSVAIKSNAQWEQVSRIDPVIKYYTPLDTMLGVGYTGKGCKLQYTIIYGLADTVFTTIEIPNDTTSSCTLFIVRHPFWTGGLTN